MFWFVVLEVLGLFSRCLYFGVEGMLSVGKGGKNLLVVFFLNIKKYIVIFIFNICWFIFLCFFVLKNNIVKVI